MGIEFRPESWIQAGGDTGTEGTDFATVVRAKLAGMDMGAMGANEGGTMMDTALSIIFPPVFSALEETINGISTGLGDEGALMEQTGIAYLTTEQNNEDTADQIWS